jgi:hypothetical protein
MNTHTITTGTRFPVTAVAIALALAVVLSILALQGAALVSTHSSPPVVTHLAGSDASSGWVNTGPCTYKSSRTPFQRCLSGSSERGNTDVASRRHTLQQWIAAHTP